MISKIKKIKMIISDIDGVWTDGSFYKGTDGQEFKKFNVNDGVGVAMANAAGYKIALISGRYSPATCLFIEANGFGLSPRENSESY